MAESDRADLERVAADVVAAVERLLAEGRRGMVVVSVHPGSRKPLGRPRQFYYRAEHEDESEAA